MRKHTKRLIASIMAFALIFSGWGIHAQAVGKTAIKLNKAKASVKVGKKVTLKVVKKNVKKISSVKWTSKNKKIATVSAKGVVKGKKAGKATISCTVKYQKGTQAKVSKAVLKCKITVKDASSDMPDVPDAPDTSGNPSATGTEPGETGGPSATGTVPGSPSDPTATGTVPGNPSDPTATGTVPGNTNDPSATGSPTAPSTGQPDATGNPSPQITTEPVAEEEAVLFSQNSGTYDNEFELTLASKQGTSIYYTTDGTDPRTSATRKAYTSGISIKSRKNDANVLSAIDPKLFDKMNNGTVAPSNANVDKCSVIRAVSCDANGNMSDVVSKTYFIGKMSQHISNIERCVSAGGKNLAVISVIMDKDDLFDYERGIYVKGKIYDDAVKSGMSGSSESTPCNFTQKGREWERNCHMEYFESDGTTTSYKAGQDCGIRIQGNYSRLNVQKSFRLYARADYGKKNFKYPFFGSELTDDNGKTMQKFKTLVLRNGGNDAFNYKYKDILNQSFVHDRAYETLHGRPCVLYLNGEYWGYYVLQDDVTDDFLENKHGVNKDSVIVYKGSDDKQYSKYGYKLDEGEFPEGVTEEDYYLKDTLNYLNNNAFVYDSVYQTFMAEYMDEQSAVDYYATMIYLNNGYDWPGKNWSIWRTLVKDENSAYSDSRWRFCLFDLDLTTEPTWGGSSGNSWSKNPITSLAGKSSSNVIKKIFGNLVENETFRTKLAEAMKELGTKDYNENLVEERAEVYKASYSALFDQFKRRFNSNNAVWCNGEGSHSGNLSFLQQRNGYVPNLIKSLDAYKVAVPSGTGSGSGSDTKEPVQTEMVDSTLVWEGSWTRGSTNNVTDTITKGMQIERDDNNYIQIMIDDWSLFTDPVIKMTVADGYSTQCRTHIWTADKQINDYYYQNQTEWIGKEFSIRAAQGGTLYINVQDATLTKFEIYNRK